MDTKASSIDWQVWPGSKKDNAQRWPKSLGPRLGTEYPALDSDTLAFPEPP